MTQQGDKQESDGEVDGEDEEEEDEEDEEDSLAADDESDAFVDSETATTSGTGETAEDDSQDSDTGELVELADATAVAEPEETEEAESQEVAAASQEPANLTLKSDSTSNFSPENEPKMSLSYFISQTDTNSQANDESACTITETASPITKTPPNSTSISRTFQYFPVLSSGKTKRNQSVPLTESKQTALPNRSIMNPDQPIIID